jgi:hypothetical protein
LSLSNQEKTGSDSRENIRSREGSNNNKKGKRRRPSYGRKKKISNNTGKENTPMSKEAKRKLIAKAAKELRQQKGLKDDEIQGENNLLDIVTNPFKAGKKLRRTIESLTGLSPEKKAFYLDDRFNRYDGSGMSLAERNPALKRQSDYVPEVLVVGATGEVGRLVVRRLLLDGNVRVRVLVRDLYSKTLNLLGTGVTYCQGDLGNYESLEYAVTDVDKIIFCAGAPRPDEIDFQQKFDSFLRETFAGGGSGEITCQGLPILMHQTDTSDSEWEQLDSVLQLRAKLAEQVDCVGMQNLVRAYQNVRFADYGASQTAKRSLFKFGSKNQDFNLFAIDDDGEEEELETLDDSYPYDQEKLEMDEDVFYNTMTDLYNLTDGEEYSSAVHLQQSILTKMHCLWMRNKFNHAVFVGKVLASDFVPRGGEAAVVSSRLRSREDPGMGIDLSNEFGGFIIRVCSDGGNYEAFVRTELYEAEGIEYVCPFTTDTKVLLGGSISRNKFTTVRLGFENFQPVNRNGRSVDSDLKLPLFRGQDIRQLGFRFRANENKSHSTFARSSSDKTGYNHFYLAFDYIKVYRSQPEPEFVYLSDARIPPMVSKEMVRHDRKQLQPKREVESEAPVLLLEEGEISGASTASQRSSEETYFKYRGEEILRNSGLSYSIVRVSGYNEIPSSDTSTVELTPYNDNGVAAVSRADVAQVCTAALLDPNALNKSFYVSKKLSATAQDEDMSAKFANLPADTSYG